MRFIHILIVIVISINSISQSQSSQSLSFKINYTNDIPNQSHTVNTSLMSFLQDSYPINLTTRGIPNIMISLGSHREHFYVSLSGSHSYLAFHYKQNEIYHHEESKTFSFKSNSIELPFIYRNSKGRKVEDSLSMNDIALRDFPFFMLEDDYFSYRLVGSLGLGYSDEGITQINDIKFYSFINQLLLQGYIGKKVYSIYNVQDSKSSSPSQVITFGDYPNKVKNARGYSYKRCNVLDKSLKGNPNPKWECALHAVYFDDYTFYQLKTRLTFSLSGEYISINFDQLSYLKEKYFKKKINEMTCWGEFLYSMEVIKCKDTMNIGDFDNILGMTLIIGKWSLKFKPKDLFIHNKEERTIIFKLIHNPSISDSWVIGHNALLPEHVIVFDKDKKSIGILMK